MVEEGSTGRVVLVDSKIDYRRTVKSMLAEAVAPRRVLEAGTVRELLAALVLDQRLACAIIAWEFAEEGGRAAAESLWLLAPRTPVIFYTGNAELALSADDFPAPVMLLCKPLRVWDIRAALRRLGVATD
jgi:FixJ family two-component response regulator